MPDLSRIEGFDWDDGNDRKSADKHGVSRQEAEQVFLDPYLLILVDDTHSQSEDRFIAYGMTEEERLLQVNFTLRSNSTLIRVISARPMSRKERQRYDEET